MHTVTIQLNSSPQEALSRVCQSIRDNGADISGDGHTGKFQGKGFAGNYRISGVTLVVEFHQKPSLVP